MQQNFSNKYVLKFWYKIATKIFSKKYEPNICATNMYQNLATNMWNMYQKVMNMYSVTQSFANSF